MIEDINKIQDSIIEEFSVFDSWMDKYEYIIDLGKSLEPIEEVEKIDENLIKGCQSRIWLICKEKDGKLFFSADSDAIITKGIVALLIKVYNGQEIKDIIESKLYFIDEIGLSANLSPTRANGLNSMIDKIRFYALAFNTKNTL